MSDLTNHKKKWDSLAKAWGEIRSPGRPSISDLKNYRELLEKTGKYGKVLILGSTPEIRDLFTQMKREGVAMEYTCVDMSKDMFSAMSGLSKESSRDEKFIESSWLNMSGVIPEKSFDVVVGDWVTVNIGEERDRFYGEICKVLVDGGFYIERAGTITPQTIKVSDVYLELKRQADRVKAGEISKEQAWNYFGSTLMMSCWFLNDKKRVDWGVSYQDSIPKLEQQVLENGDEVEKYILDIFKKVNESSAGKFWTVHTQKEQEEEFEKYFDIVDKRISDDYDKVVAEQSPLYLLKKK